MYLCFTWNVQWKFRLTFTGTYPADTDAFKTFSGRLTKITTSYHQTTRCQDVWKKTSDLWRLEDVLFTSSWRRPIYEVLKNSDLDVLRTSDLRRLQDLCRLEVVQFKTSWRWLIYNVLRTSDLQRLQDVQFTSSWGRPICDVFKTSDLRRFKETSDLYNVLKKSNLCRLEDVQFTTSVNNVCVATS